MGSFRPQSDAPLTVMPTEAALELAGRSIGFVAWCLATDGSFVPMITFIKGGKIGLGKLEVESRDEALKVWNMWIEENPEKVDHSAFVSDGSITTQAVRTDAILTVIANHADRTASRVIARYRPKGWLKKFRVEAPEILIDRGDPPIVAITGDNRVAFFRGVRSFGQGLELWSEHMGAEI